jgi:hypothetical protein
MRSLNVLFEGWRLAGALLAVAGGGASIMAATVNSKLAHHAEQTDQLLVELRAIHRLQEVQVCLEIGVETKLACVQYLQK